MALGADTPLVAARKFGKLATGMANVPRTTLETAAKEIKRSVEGQLVLAGVRSGKLRGVGKRGARVGVRYDFGNRRQSVLVRATGPFQLLERNTKPHRIPKERGGRARKRLVVIPGVGPRASANHPGTHGKHPWAKGTALADQLVATAGKKALRSTLTGVFR